MYKHNAEKARIRTGRENQNQMSHYSQHKINTEDYTVRHTEDRTENRERKEMSLDIKKF